MLFRLFVILGINVATLAALRASIHPGFCYAEEVRVVDSNDTVDAELSALRNGLIDAFKQRNVPALLSYVTQDIIVTWQNAEVSRGKNELQAYIERMLSGPDSIVSRVEGSPTVEGRKIYDNQIISFGHMNDSFTLRSTGQELLFDSRFSAFIVRENGNLRLSGLHLSANAFENSALDYQISIYKNGALWGTAFCLILGIFIGRRWKRAS
jgi:hypothetical protein